MILKLKNKKRIFIPVPVFFAKMLGRMFQHVQKVPLFTEEHVKGVLQDTKLDSTFIKKDLAFTPTTLEKALTASMKVIGDDWNEFLKPKAERKVDLESLDF